jgi:CRISPR-associated protein Csd2
LKHESKKLPKKEEDARKVTQWMCQNFFDIRTFGAVMSTDVNTGQVRGPVQLNFARSIEPVVSAEHSITRMAVTTEKEAEQQSGDNRTMGRKFTIPYGLYRCHGFISANLAKQTGFGEEDLELLWDTLINMLDHDRSASRGEMSPCGLYVFKHESPLGNAPARKLFELIDVNRVSEGPARDFSDYQVTVREGQLPSGVQLIKYLE